MSRERGFSAAALVNTAGAAHHTGLRQAGADVDALSPWWTTTSTEPVPLPE